MAGEKIQLSPVPGWRANLGAETKAIGPFPPEIPL